jgi:hypothetical protein
VPLPETDVEFEDNVSIPKDATQDNACIPKDATQDNACIPKDATLLLSKRVKNSNVGGKGRAAGGQL